MIRCISIYMCLNVGAPFTKGVPGGLLSAVDILSSASLLSDEYLQHPSNVELLNNTTNLKQLKEYLYQSRPQRFEEREKQLQLNAAKNA